MFGLNPIKKIFRNQKKFNKSGGKRGFDFMGTAQQMQPPQPGGMMQSTNPQVADQTSVGSVPQEDYVAQEGGEHKFISDEGDTLTDLNRGAYKLGGMTSAFRNDWPLKSKK